MQQVQVSVPNAGVDGTTAYPLGGKFGDQLLTEWAPRYYNLAYRGLVMSATNTGAQAVTAGLPALAYTGLCISNPVGNNKNLVMLAGQFATTVATAGTDIASIHLISGYAAATNVTHTLALTTGPTNMLLGTGTVPTAKADSQATVTGTPRWMFGLQSGFTAQTLPAVTPSLIDFGGNIIVPPGGWIAWGALLGLSGFGTFIWAELPV